MWTQLSMDTVVKSCQALEIYVMFFYNFFKKIKNYWGFRRDVRPRGFSLQGTIPSLSAMVFSCPGGAFF